MKKIKYIILTLENQNIYELNKKSVKKGESQGANN